MTRSRSQNMQSPPDHGAESEFDFEQDSFSYLNQGAIAPARQPKNFRRTSSRRGFVAASLAAIGATAWVGVPLNTSGAFYPGTQVNGLNIAELDRPQATALMRSHFADFENTAVDFVFERQNWNASLAQLGFAIDYDSTLDAAWQHGRTSNKFDQFKTVLIEPKQRSFPVIFTSNTDTLNAYLQDLGTQIVGAARDALLYLDEDQVRIRPNEDGRALDIEAAAAATARIVQRAQRGTVELTAMPVVSQITAERLEPKRILAQTMINAPVHMDTGDEEWTVSQSTLRAALVLPTEGVLTDPTLDENVIGQSLTEMATATYKEPTNAVLGWEESLVVIEPDIRGRELDIETTTRAIVAAAQTTDSRTIDAVFAVKLAEVNSEDLDSLGIIDLVAQGDSNFDGSAWERAENVRVSASHVTHTLVKPGERFSFNQSIGAITEENGFVRGKIIRGTRIVEDIGGGACQASTTVFRAALLAGFPIEHHYHQYRLAMYEHDGWAPGLDAAIFQPDEGSYDTELDMFFTNTTENWLLVEFVIDEIMAYCRIYGTPPGYDIDIEVPYVSEAKKPDKPIETEDPNLSKDERQQVGFPTDGYDVQALRTIRQNGEVVVFDDRPNPWEFWSYFQPQREEWLIGPGTRREFDTDTTPTPTTEG